MPSQRGERQSSSGITDFKQAAKLLLDLPENVFPLRILKPADGVVEDISDLLSRGPIVQRGDQVRGDRLRVLPRKSTDVLFVVGAMRVEESAVGVGEIGKSLIEGRFGRSPAPIEGPSHGVVDQASLVPPDSRNVKLIGVPFVEKPIECVTGRFKVARLLKKERQAQVLLECRNHVGIVGLLKGRSDSIQRALHVSRRFEPTGLIEQFSVPLFCGHCLWTDLLSRS